MAAGCEWLAASGEGGRQWSREGEAFRCSSLTATSVWATIEMNPARVVQHCLVCMLCMALVLMGIFFVCLTFHGDRRTISSVIETHHQLLELIFCVDCGIVSHDSWGLLSPVSVADLRIGRLSQMLSGVLQRKCCSGEGFR